jgi:hypothetical protein
MIIINIIIIIERRGGPSRRPTRSKWRARNRQV